MGDVSRNEKTRSSCSPGSTLLTNMRYIVVCVLVLGSCSNFIPLQDCGHVSDIKVEGIVVDINGWPIANAEIKISSTNENLCPNAPDFDSVVTKSQEDGRFDYTFGGMSEGEIIVFEVSAKGYLKYSTSSTYTLFDEEIEVELFPHEWYALFQRFIV